MSREWTSQRSSDKREWLCFHCDEVFTTVEEARVHFGETIVAEPACKLNQTETTLAGIVRDQERELARLRDEDGPNARQFHALGAEHYRREREAEEKGYARGLRDARWRSWLNWAWARKVVGG